MIISCPSCATRYELPAQQLAADGSVIRCAACGHNWLEASAIEVIDISPVTALAPAGRSNEPAQSASQLPMVIEDDDQDAVDLDLESNRIAAAAAKAEREFDERRRARRANVVGWGGLVSAIAVTFAGLYAFPNQIVHYAPGAAGIYERAGIEINRRGFEIRNIRQQHLLSDGTRVLALRGEVVNVSGRELKVPALRFVIKDEKRREVYAWTLNGVSTKALAAEGSTTFVTRLAAPPETADEIEIRFAQAGEIGSNAQP